MGVRSDDAVVKSAVVREVRVSREVHQHSDKTYIYGAVKITLPKKFIGRRAKIIVVIE